ncbi:hypothetical protein KGQ34_02700 [Patescibacteria group bacterium]|nr:hypothetical protein [Patescibacteria group bacterium]
MRNDLMGKNNIGFIRKHFGFFGRVTLAFALSGMMLPLAAIAAPASSSLSYTRFFYYRDSVRARQSLFAHPDLIDVLAPQSYSFNIAGKLTGGMRANILRFAKKHNIKVMPLVTNRKFSKGAYQTLLNDAAMQDSAIASLVAEAKKNNYWGWQFDFEQMDASYRDLYSAFIKKAADALKQNNLVISVAVIAQISDNSGDYPNDLWQKTIGVYDYSSLASSADFISVMSYDDPNSTGPVAEYSWLKQVIAYSAKLIPHDKLSLGIPLYYWKWNNATGARVGIGGRKGIANVIQKHKVAFHYSIEHEAPYLTYWNRAKQYVIWYENARSVAKKIGLIKENHLHGFSAWALGLELSSVYSAIQR